MNTIILGAAIGVVIACIFGALNKSKVSKYLIGSTFAAAIGAFFGAMIAGTIICSMVPTKDVVYGPGKLVAMRSADGISGTFVWGSGSISSRTTYNFMQVLDDGSMKPGWVYADDLVRLIEDPELKNVGYWRTTIREVDPASPLNAWALGTGTVSTTVRQEFRVPVGTVVQQFNVK